MKITIKANSTPKTRRLGNLARRTMRMKSKKDYSRKDRANNID